MVFDDEIKAALHLGSVIVTALQEKGFKVDYEGDHNSGEMFVEVGDYELVIRTSDFEEVEPEEDAEECEGGCGRPVHLCAHSEGSEQCEDIDEYQARDFQERPEDE